MRVRGVSLESRKRNAKNGRGGGKGACFFFSSGKHVSFVHDYDMILPRSTAYKKGWARRLIRSTALAEYCLVAA